jgi:hypothetical protein
MKGISLIKVTMAIVATALLSLVVSAEENGQVKNIAVELAKTQQVEFSELDSDKNGSLTEVEVAANKALHHAVAKVDTNGDATISKGEYNNFIVNMNK